MAPLALAMTVWPLVAPVAEEEESLLSVAAAVVAAAVEGWRTSSAAGAAPGAVLTLAARAVPRKLALHKAVSNLMMWALPLLAAPAKPDLLKSVRPAVRKGVRDRESSDLRRITSRAA